MQEDYEIVVIVSLFIMHYSDFLLKLLPECRK
jgi:hypothetical protein